MSIVDEKYCACGKRWSEPNPNCVFNYHPKPKSTIIIPIRLEEIVNCGWCDCLVKLSKLESHTNKHHKGANVWID